MTVCNNGIQFKTVGFCVTIICKQCKRQPIEQKQNQQLTVSVGAPHRCCAAYVSEGAEQSAAGASGQQLEAQATDEVRQSTVANAIKIVVTARQRRFSILQCKSAIETKENFKKVLFLCLASCLDLVFTVFLLSFELGETA